VQPVVVEPELAEGYEAARRRGCRVPDEGGEVADDGCAPGGVYGLAVEDGLGGVGPAGGCVLVV
jgi:hypothetical protein